MTTTISGENELDLLERIVTEAKDKTEPKIPTITDVLKVYDDFIHKKMILSGSPIAQSIYKKVLHAARRTKVGEIWIDKLFDTQPSKPQISNISNIYEQNTTEQPYFSFSRETVDENRLLNNNSFSYAADQRLTSSFTDIQPPKDENTLPRKSLRIEENSIQHKRPPSSRDSRRGRWGDNIEGVYRNRHLGDMRSGYKEANSMNLDTQSTKYRGQSPPIRDGNVNRSMQILLEDKENYDSNRVTRETVGATGESGDLTQVYNIFKYTKEGRERSRTPSISGTNLPRQAPPSKERSTEYNTRPTDVSMQMQDPRKDVKMLSSSFEDMKLWNLRRERAGRKIADVQKNIMGRVKNKAMNKWRNFVKAARDVENGEAEWNEVYNKRVLKKHFANWKKFHEEISKFTKNTRKFLMFCGRNSANKIFQAWKKMHYEKKTDRINRLAAQAMCDKNRAKKFIAAWKEYKNEKVLEYY